MLHGETGSFDIIRQHSPGGSHYTRILCEKALGDLQVLRVEIEIIIDEEQNIVVAGQGEDCVSLPGESQFGLDKGHVREKAGGVCYVRRLCVGDEDSVRLSSLFGQEGDCFREDRGATAGGDANNQPGLAFHGDQLNRWRSRRSQPSR